MNDQILNLCKRLNKFSLDEICCIAEIDENEILPVLKELISKNKLFLNNDTYFYNKIVKLEKLKLPVVFQYYPKNVIDLVLKGFCLDIPAHKICMLTDIGENGAFNIYNFIREFLYKKQAKQLFLEFDKKPQIARYREFFENMIAYFYIYKNQVYVCEKPLVADKEHPFSKNQIKEFKKVYSYLLRIECHNKNKINMYYKLAEALWRRNKDFEQLYFELKNMLCF